jgi:protocatechuate 3,4-dioxygenase alpha subunit
MDGTGERFMTRDRQRAATPGQTIGPFFGYALPFIGDDELVPPAHPCAVALVGRVVDGAGQPVPDALIEVWQPDAEGNVSQKAGSLHRDGRTFTGWGRASTDNTGTYRFTTLRPGPTTNGRLPFFAVTVFARGLLNRLFTRAYLPADEAAVQADPFLATVPEERRHSLLAQQSGQDLLFDIHLQGPGETVFLRFPGDRP